MGKIIKILSLVILILVCSILLIRLFIGKHQSALYKVFEVKTDGYYLHKFLGLIPKEVQERYSEKLLGSSNGSEVIFLSDKSSPINTNFIVLHSGSKEAFIKAYPFELLKKGSASEIDLKNHVSHLIDVDVFNQYLKEFDITGKEEAIEKYCFFLSILEDCESYRIVKNLADIDTIITRHPLSNIEVLVGSGYSIIDLNSFEFEESEEVTYCWFVNHGLVKFNFTFEGGELIKVESTSLGYLGNEFPSCC
jgi:hypothetical protein